MFKCLVWLLTIRPLLASYVPSESNELNCFNLEDIHYITIDLTEIEGLCLNSNTSECNTELEFDFEIEQNKITPEDTYKVQNETFDKSYHDRLTKENKNRVLIITACTAAALAATVAIIILGKDALLNYLQSGKYELPENERGAGGFHEMGQVNC